MSPGRPRQRALFYFGNREEGVTCENSTAKIFLARALYIRIYSPLLLT